MGTSSPSPKMKPQLFIVLFACTFLPRWFQYLALILLVPWSIYIIKFFNHFFSSGVKCIREPDMPLMSTVPCSARYDAVDWPKLKIYIGGIFLVPVRLFIIFGSTAIACGLCILTRIIFGTKDLTEEQSSTYWFIQQTIIAGVCKTNTWFAGFKTFERKTHKCSDFLPGYEKFEKAQEGKIAPIQICNHSTVFDEMYLLTNGHIPGFLAKWEVKELPFMGKFAECMQGIFVKRGSEESKQWTLDQISLRIDNILAGKRFPPMAIYPEGTTNNGRDLMHFKRGAFMNEAPLKIYGFEIDSKDVNPTWNLLTTAQALFLQMSRYDYALVLHEFDNFDPKYTIERHGLTPGDSENNLEFIYDDVRYLMEYGMGFRTAGNSSWSKKHELEIHYELNGLISKGMVHPREMARYACPKLSRRKSEGNVNGFGSKMGSLGGLLSLGFARDMLAQVWK